MFVFNRDFLNAWLAERLEALVVNVQDRGAHVDSEVVEVVEYLLVLSKQVSELLEMIVNVFLLGGLLELLQVESTEYLFINIPIVSSDHVLSLSALVLL